MQINLDHLWKRTNTAEMLIEREQYGNIMVLLKEQEMI